MQYQDGTKQSEFKAMSEEDKKWLEEAMKSFTFNDVDRLKEICEELKGHMSMGREHLMGLLDELLEIVELHVRNSINLCLGGGM